MDRFTFPGLADIHLCYGMAQLNAYEARRIYQERFPQRALPSPYLFTAVDRHIRETGLGQVS